MRLHAATGAALARDAALAGEGSGLRAAGAGPSRNAALDLPLALPAVIDAATSAMASYAPAEALRQLERAQQIWPRVADARQRTGLDEAEASPLAAVAAYQSEPWTGRSGCSPALAGLPASFNRFAGRCCWSGTR